MGLLGSKTMARMAVCMAGWALCASTAMGQGKDEFEYERASLYSMLVQHPRKQFSNEIEFVFTQMAKPERFNDHSLGAKLVFFAEADSHVEKEMIDNFVKTSAMGRRLVARWFNRKKKTGMMDLELIKERGYYNSSNTDKQLARAQIRGRALLEDAGEELLGNTYFIMNDIFYHNTKETVSLVSEWVNLGATIKDAWQKEKRVDDDKNPFRNPALSHINSLGFDQIKGFQVKVKSYLYRLKWNKEVADEFYEKYYVDQEIYDEQKVKDFDKSADLFELEYMGMIDAGSTQTRWELFKKRKISNEDLVTITCTRAIDENIAKLQHKVPEFRIKAPLVGISPLVAEIGMKEDVNENSRFEVLERRVDDKGKVKYKKVGEIKPKAGRIWDNRFMAEEEDTPESKLGKTEFETLSGKDFYPGMLIREIESK